MENVGFDVISELELSNQQLRKKVDSQLAVGRRQNPKSSGQINGVQTHEMQTLCTNWCFRDVGFRHRNHTRAGNNRHDACKECMHTGVISLSLPAKMQNTAQPIPCSACYFLLGMAF